jgi:hypothetical protein
MTTRRSIIAFAIGAVVLGVALPATAQSAGTPALATKTSDAGGVRVVVKPKNVGTGPTWEFEVTMDTHSKPLNDDLTKAAVLVDGNGRRYTAANWQGDPPGGHHRKGVLRFPAPPAPAKSFELQMQGVGGVSQRVFQWTSK